MDYSWTVITGRIEDSSSTAIPELQPSTWGTIKHDAGR
jgi:hypothetical protein